MTLIDGSIRRSRRISSGGITWMSRRSERYWRELKNVARGDLGYSFKLGDFTVNRVIAEGLPVSAALGVLALTFARRIWTAWPG